MSEKALRFIELLEAGKAELDNGYPVFNRNSFKNACWFRYSNTIENYEWSLDLIYWNSVMTHKSNGYYYNNHILDNDTSYIINYLRLKTLNKNINQMEETVKKLNDFINETFNDNDDFLLNRGINSKIRENPQIKPLLDKMTSYLKQIEDDLSKLNELELENKTHSTSIITTRSKQRQILSDYNINIAKYKLQIVKERLNCSELYSQLLLKERDSIGSEQDKIRMEVKTLKKLVNDLELENDVFTTDLSVIREYIRQPGCQILTKDNLLYNDFLLYQRWLLSKLRINGTDSINENDNMIQTAISTLLSEVDQLDEQRFECGMKDKTINGLKSQIRVLDKTNNELDNERRELILSIENHKNMNEGQTHKLSTLLDTMNKNENRLVSDNNRLIYDNSIINSENAKLDLEVKILKNSVIEKNADIIGLEYRLNNSELEKNDLIKSVLALVPELEYSPQTGFSLKCDYEVIDTNDINIK